ncbi:hypothetical protein EYC80_005846 [Monilinia laxa]|uniref:Plastocyanin-like domain-containing protein n=1 Tax=Monilinia laxa TaxID=61186 RepID=A0A5N6KFA0_MONLA|nr:hypothetical protein EYC80_005846 [Monilinia laxa]
MQYWLIVQNTTLSFDGVARSTINFNGTIPGPQITADWDDNVIVHVTNKLTNNETSIHWHGMRQLNNSHSWYHSHFILQYGGGLFGPLITNGPATGNYDANLGALFLNAWNHVPIQSLWDRAKTGEPPTLLTGLINGTNIHNGVGEKFSTTFTTGLKYRIRLINTAVDGHMQFSTDGHNFTVIVNSFVPIVPYNASSILISTGQRNTNAANITGILRFIGSSITANPKSTATVKASTSCLDKPLTSLIPIASTTANQD